MKTPAPEETFPRESGSPVAGERPSSQPCIASLPQPPGIPDHELLRRIGSGSYGEVWLARNALGAYRAVKIVYRKSFEDSRPFEREFNGIQKFEPISRSHEGLVDILQAGRQDDYFYYVMELADDAAENPNDECRNPKAARNPNDKTSPAAQELRVSRFGFPSSFDIRHSDLYTPRSLRHDLKQRGHLPVEQCIEIGLALADALAHLHKHGLVHRDIKPSNIIFVNGAPKLADIGLVTDADTTLSYVGTEGYIPPEGPGAAQADVFSLGKVLYEISTGQDRRQFPDLPPNLKQCPDQAPLLELNEVLLKACVRDARLRYQSAEAMRADLALLQCGKSVKRLRAWERSSSHAKKAVLAIMALTVLAAIVYSLPVRKSPAPAIEWSRNEEANDAFRNGILVMHTGSGEALTEAVRLFERAIEIDPTFARAYARLAMAYEWLGPDDSELLKKALSAAEKALALNGGLDDAHAAVAWPKAVLERDWRGAEKEELYALNLNPNSEDNLYGYIPLLVIEGRITEALPLMEKALRLDSRSVLYLQSAGWVFSAARQYDHAIQKFEEVIAKQPSSRLRLAHLLAPAYREKGDYLMAIKVEEEAALLKGEDADQVKAKYKGLREAYGRDGAPGYWQQQLDLSKNDENNPVRLAALYARVGNKDKAYHYLNLAFERTPTKLVFEINRDPSFDSLRGEHDFREVLTRLGLGK